MLDDERLGQKPIMSDGEEPDDEGASPDEQLVEACRRNNDTLYDSVMKDLSSSSNKEIAKFLDGVTDPMGNHLLHICADNGSYHVMDKLLDVEGLECDPHTRRDEETPLHVCVRFANERDVETGTEMARMAIDAGCDPRAKDKYGRTPRDTVSFGRAGLDELRDMLAMEEYVANEGLRDGDGVADEREDDVGSASDSE